MDLNKIGVVIDGVEYPRTTNSNAFFKDLVYSVGFGSVGNGTVDIYSTTRQANVKVGSILCITYDSTPLYSGYITAITDTNNWCYYSTSDEKVIVSVSFKEASGLLEHVSPTTTGSFVGTPGQIAEKILGPYVGIIQISGDDFVAFGVSEDSILNQLNKLSRQTGWRYRVRPTSTTTFVIDFSPSFYEKDARVGTFKINLSARNNNETNSTYTEYGEVVATSSSVIGSSSTCAIPLLGKHNKDYTIDYTKRVTVSWDGDCIHWQYNSSNKNSYKDALGNEIVLNEPYHTISAIINCDIDPMLLLKDLRLVYYIGGSPYAILLQDLYKNNKFMAKQVVNSGIEIPGYYSIIFEGTQDMIDAMENETGGGDFLIYGLKGTKYQLNDCVDMPASGMGYIGSEEAPYTVLDASTGWIEITSTNVKYLHKKGVLFSYINTPAIDSPKYLYPDTKFYATLQSGLSYPVTDYMASILAIYGSNFDAQGSCMVPLSMFKRDDGGLLWVGDRIGIYNSKEKVTNDYELLSYTVSIQTMTVTVKYGTYIVGLPDIINGIKSNMTTSIRQ